MLGHEEYRRRRDSARRDRDDDLGDLRRMLADGGIDSPEPPEAQAVTKTGSRNEQGITETLSTRFIVFQRRGGHREEREMPFLTAD